MAHQQPAGRQGAGPQGFGPQGFGPQGGGHQPPLQPPSGKDGHQPLNFGTVAAGSGVLTQIDGTIYTTTTVSTPVTVASGNFNLIDNESNAVVAQTGTGNVRILELGTGTATFTLGNGNDVVTDFAGASAIAAGNGDMNINLGGVGNIVTVGNTLGGTHDVTAINAGSGSATVTAGNGSIHIAAGGANNIITVGTGNDTIDLRGPVGPGPHGSVSATASITADTLHLGNGTNQVFLGGSGNTIYDGSGTDTIQGAGAGNDTFVVNASGGTISIGGFSLTNGDSVDLTAILSGVSASAVTASPSTYLSLTNIADPHHASWTDAVLTVKGTGGTASVTFVDSGSLTLSGVLSAGVLKL
jgi:hypothetical protein